jgi:hypothetical protein
MAAIARQMMVESGGTSGTFAMAERFYDGPIAGGALRTAYVIRFQRGDVDVALDPDGRALADIVVDAEWKTACVLTRLRFDDPRFLTAFVEAQDEDRLRIAGDVDGAPISLTALHDALADHLAGLDGD